MSGRAKNPDERGGRTDVPLERTQAFARLRSGLGSLADLVERLDGAEGDRERRSVLLLMTAAAGDVRDQAADAYEALEHAHEQDGIDKGVLE